MTAQDMLAVQYWLAVNGVRGNILSKCFIAQRCSIEYNYVRRALFLLCRNTVVIVNATANHNQGKYDKEPMSVAEK